MLILGSMAAHEAVDATTPEPLIPEDTFGLRLIIVRRALGLSQQEAAERCGLDDGSWSNWESGTKPRGLDEVVRTIAERLHVDRDWLMWGGPLRSGSFAPGLVALPEPSGEQLDLLAELDSIERRSFLTSV
jgi:transcriptional regulator with XRE-family HTH domain